MPTILQLNDQFKVNDEYFSKQTIHNKPYGKFIQCVPTMSDKRHLKYGLTFNEDNGQFDLYSWDGQQWGLEEVNVKVSD